MAQVTELTKEVRSLRDMEAEKRAEKPKQFGRDKEMGQLKSGLKQMRKAHARMQKELESYRESAGVKQTNNAEENTMRGGDAVNKVIDGKEHQPKQVPENEPPSWAEVA